MGKEVIEDDFRLPEYKGANVADYEFDDVGNLVRKDRWETAIRDIWGALEQDPKLLTIPLVMQAIQHLKDNLMDTVRLDALVANGGHISWYNGQYQVICYSNGSEARRTALYSTPRQALDELLPQQQGPHP